MPIVLSLSSNPNRFEARNFMFVPIVTPPAHTGFWGLIILSGVAVFDFQGQQVAFFGSFLEVTPPTRIVWTNEEGGAEAGALSTATFEERGDGTTLVTMHDVYPSKEALDAAIASGSTEGAPEQLAQLDALVVSLA